MEGKHRFLEPWGRGYHLFLFWGFFELYVILFGQGVMWVGKNKEVGLYGFEDKGRNLEIKRLGKIIGFVL